MALCSELSSRQGGQGPSAVLLNVMVTLCGRAGEHQRAKQLLEVRGRQTGTGAVGIQGRAASTPQQQ